ncbi:MAG: DUF1801 domain-containing protein [Flavobacteriales bacterium]|jgi:uncharacterized protein YdhG (YjbR/CyaY superfamily)|nr:DUF1801 domain-containing protein [Flavobacteriales bacterium]
MRPSTSPKPTTIAAYIAAAPAEARPLLNELYALLKSVAPDAKEAIKWGSPVFEEGRILFAFSAHRKHANFVPTPASLAPFKKELAGFTVGRIAMQLPYDKPLPKALIRKIALHRAKDVRENDARWM